MEEENVLGGTKALNPATFFLQPDKKYYVIGEAIGVTVSLPVDVLEQLYSNNEIVETEGEEETEERRRSLEENTVLVGDMGGDLSEEAPEEEAPEEPDIPEEPDMGSPPNVDEEGGLGISSYEEVEEQQLSDFKVG